MSSKPQDSVDSYLVIICLFIFLYSTLSLTDDYHPSLSCCSTLYSITTAVTLAVAVTAAAARLVCLLWHERAAQVLDLVLRTVCNTCAFVSLPAALACRTDAITAACACTASTPLSHNSYPSSATCCAGRGCPLGISAHITRG
jgi:hypothetical protein